MAPAISIAGIYAGILKPIRKLMIRILHMRLLNYLKTILAAARNTFIINGNIVPGTNGLKSGSGGKLISGWKNVGNKKAAFKPPFYYC